MVKTPTRQQNLRLLDIRIRNTFVSLPRFTAGTNCLNSAGANSSRSSDRPISRRLRPVRLRSSSSGLSTAKGLRAMASRKSGGRSHVRREKHTRARSARVATVKQRMNSRKGSLVYPLSLQLRNECTAFLHNIRNSKLQIPRSARSLESRLPEL